MGVDVWVQRPGGPLAGVGPWGSQALVQAEPEVAVQATPDMSEAAAPVGVTPVARAATPPSAPFEPASGDVAARWDALRTEVLTCTKCVLHQTRTQGVVGVGPRRSDWMVIGEAPGAEEDRRGEPFVGRAGHLLDAMLHAIGLNRGTNVYIANVLKSRPPGNRDPKPDEVAACLPYLMRQIELLQPRLMLASAGSRRRICSAPICRWAGYGAKCITSASLIHRSLSRIIPLTSCGRRLTSRRPGRT